MGFGCCTRATRPLMYFSQAYTDELVELHRRLMALRERNVLQQVPCPPLPDLGIGAQLHP